MTMFKKFLILFFTLLILNFNFATAEDVTIPNWVFIVYDFLIEEKISDQEFIAMLHYLEQNKIIDLILPVNYDIKTNFLLSIEGFKSPDQYTSCTDGWKVTGYFVPVEEDYSGKTATITINDESRDFKQDFVDVIMIEGWGRTISGDYLGWYDDTFHIQQIPLDREGSLLRAGNVAIDETILDHDAKILISTLPYPWNTIEFIATDIGPAIKGKHIDLYTGEGKLAEQETFRVTSSNNTLCE